MYVNDWLIGNLTFRLTLPGDDAFEWAFCPALPLRLVCFLSMALCDHLK